jgi:hypothetical protein
MVTQPTTEHTPDGKVDMPPPRVAERTANGAPGPVALIGCLLVALIGLAAGGLGAVLIVVGVLILVTGIVSLTGLTSVGPGQARVVQLFGRYVGTARALCEVDEFVAFVNTQAETAVRHIATSYPYDGGATDQLSLWDNSDQITEQRHRRGPATHRGRRRGHGAVRVGTPGHRAGRGTGRGTEGHHGVQPAGRAVRGPRRAAGGQHRFARPVIRDREPIRGRHT